MPTVPVPTPVSITLHSLTRISPPNRAKIARKRHFIDGIRRLFAPRRWKFREMRTRNENEKNQREEREHLPKIPRFFADRTTPDEKTLKRKLTDNLDVSLGIFARRLCSNCIVFTTLFTSRQLLKCRTIVEKAFSRNSSIDNGQPRVFFIFIIHAHDGFLFVVVVGDDDDGIGAT